VNYVSDYTTPDQGGFTDLYSSTAPLLELCYTLRYNTPIAAIGLDIAYGYYSASASSSLIGGAQLTAQEDRAGVRLILDSFMREPIFAPYVMVGGYQFTYSETQGSAALNGRTSFGPYWGVGAMIQTNWVDTEAALNAYKDGSIENFFVFVEARQYLPSGVSGEEDFSSPVTFSTGVSVEF
jgi:hypothetical protein